MALKTYQIPFGKGFQPVDLPEEKVIYDIHGNKAEVKPDLKAETLRALRNPIGSKPLREVVQKGDKVAITASDLTRLVRSKDFLPVVLDELNAAGVPDSDIILVVATGTHRGHTPEENLTVYGEEVVKRIKIYQHDCKASDLVYKGETSRGTPIWQDAKVSGADKIIITGAVSLHPFAGFGGGRKGVMPGVSGLKTINHNHLLALTDEVGGGCNPETICGKLEGNRVSEDMEEVCKALSPAFLVNVVFTPDGEVNEVVAGDWFEAHRKGCADLLAMHLAKIEIAEVKWGYAKLSMAADPKIHGNRYGAVHGGALFTLADTALGAVCYTIGAMVVTMSASINFIKNTMEKEMVTAEATLLHKGRSSVVCKVEIFNQAKELMVEVTGTMFIVGHFDEIPEKW